ncbi:ArsR/SmtB family transcription factor [Galenea microaerophila]
MNTLEQHAQIFKALSEPVRLRIVCLLLQRPSLCVCDLVTTLELGQSLVSRHLTTLRHAQIVEAERQGPWMNYRITETFKQNAPHLIQHLEDLLQKDAQLKKDTQSLEQYELGPKGCEIDQ